MESAPTKKERSIAHTAHPRPRAGAFAALRGRNGEIEALEAKLSRIRAILADETLNTSTAVEIAIRDVMTAD